MNRLCLSVLVAGLITVPVRAEMSANELTALATKVRASVMFMMVFDKEGRHIAGGTGFIVSEDGKLITNRHIANAGPRLTAKAPNGRQYRVLGVLAEDSDQDLVVLQVENSRQPPLPLGNSDDVREGMPVVMIGNPLELESTVQQGTIAGFRRFNGARRWIEVTGSVAGKGEEVHRRLIHGQGLQVVTDVAPGSSGSPVMDANGKVLGVITAIDRSEQPTALAIPVEVIRELVRQAATAEAPRSLETLSRRGGNDLSTDTEYSAAVKAYSSHDFEEAESRAKAVAARYPESAVAYLLLGQVYLQRKAYTDATDAFEHAIQLRRDLSPAWAGLAVTYVRQGLKDRARDIVRELEKSDPTMAKQLTDSLPAIAH